ncbi:MAG TPA: outer membrane beta-barrel protein [Coriobacteriia bacterium]|nr:outer membrane beta-barrel protein [Coriobacteriia bacterium]
MCTLSRHVKPAASLLFMLGMMTLAATSPAAAQDVCAGFDRKHTITKLGGPNALAPGGVQTRAELQAYFAANADEIRTVLASQGLGKEVANALFDAVRQGTGITERTMPEGERLQWMAYRKGGSVVTIENVCLKLPGGALAFEITVPVVTAAETARADCSIDVTADPQPGGTSTFRVRTAPGARVTLEGPDGTRTIIEGGDSTWSGPWDDPYRADYAFMVTNEGATTETSTSYAFLVPRDCLNLAFAVDQPKEQRVSRPETCSERRIVPKPVPPKPPMCTIDLDLTEARRGDVVGYRVTGEWAELDLEVLLDGAPLAEPPLTSEHGTLVPTRRGTYTIVATATNELGDTEICRASVDMVGADWIVRPFAAYLMADEKMSATVDLASCPCPARTTYGYDDGYGLGLSVERLLSERIGVEARGLYGRLDDRFWIGANGIGITESDTSDYWDLSLGLNVHLTPKGAVDWYAGPFVGYSTVDGHTSFVVDRSLEYDAEGDLTWGAQTGLDWPFGDSPWSLHVGARYTWYTADISYRHTNPEGAVHEQPESIDLDPITMELGVAYHF